MVTNRQEGSRHKRDLSSLVRAHLTQAASDAVSVCNFVCAVLVHLTRTLLLAKALAYETQSK